MVGAVARAAYRIHVGAARLQRGVHVGQLALHQLELADALAELFALVQVGHHHVHAGGHDAQRSARQHRALVVEAAHQHLGAAAFTTHHVVGRHFAVLEEQRKRVGAAHAELVEMLAVAEALEALLDDERGHAARAHLRVGLGVDDHRVGVAAVGDPHLAAVEQVMIAAALGLQCHADDVGPGAGLAHRQRADVLAADQLRQVFPLLRLAAVAVDLIDAQVRVRAVAQADCGAGAADFFHRHHVSQVAQPGAAVRLADGKAHHAELAELAPQVGRELVVAVDVGGAWCDLVLREVAHGIAQQGDVVAQIDLEGGLEHRRLL